MDLDPSHFVVRLLLLFSDKNANLIAGKIAGQLWKSKLSWKMEAIHNIAVAMIE